MVETTLEKNDTIERKDTTDIYKEVEQKNGYIVFEYDGNSEKRTRLKKRLLKL